MLARSETRLSIATDLAEDKTLRVVGSNSFDQIAASESVEIPPPQRESQANKIAGAIGRSSGLSLRPTGGIPLS